MATNPWVREDPQCAGQPHRVALGGLKAFVQRNKLTAHANGSTPGGRDGGFSSLQLMQNMRVRYEHQRQVIDELRELEDLEQTITTAGCVQPQQLQRKLEHVTALRDLLDAVLAAKSVLLRARHKDANSESLLVGLAHQQAFIDVFCKIGATLPRYTHMLGPLENMHAVASDLTNRQSAYQAAVGGLESTIVQYQAAYDELSRLRHMYSRLQEQTRLA